MLRNLILKELIYSEKRQLQAPLIMLLQKL